MGGAYDVMGWSVLSGSGEAYLTSALTRQKGKIEMETEKGREKQTVREMLMHQSCWGNELL